MKKRRGEGAVYQRGAMWWIVYYHRGKRYRKSAHTTNETTARKLLRERLADLGRGRTAAITAGRVTFAQMAEALLADYRINHKRSLKDVEKAVDHLNQFFSGDLAVDIRAHRIHAFIEAKQGEGYANASINRWLAALRRMFNLCIKDEVLEAAPKIPMLEENNVRQGTISPGDFARLLTCLPEYLRLPVEFLYRFAWRVGEARKLEWRDVNLATGELRLRPENSKNKQTRVMPLRGKLLEVIERAHGIRRPDCPFVFHHDGEAIGDFRKSWRSACRAAGVARLHIHDLRRSGITNMRRAGIPESIAMKVSGHRTVSVFRRYNIEVTRDIEQGLEQLDAYLAAEAGRSNVIPLREAHF